MINELLQAEADAVTDRPISLPFVGKDNSMLPDKKTITEIVITPLKVGTVFRITPMLMKISTEDLNKMVTNKDRKFDPEAPKLFAKYGPLLMDIICTGIHNKKTPYPDWFKSFLIENCEWKDVHILMNAILFRMGSTHFYNSTIKISKVGPTSEEELIALQKNLNTWKKNALIITEESAHSQL